MIFLIFIKNQSFSIDGKQQENDENVQEPRKTSKSFGSPKHLEKRYQNPLGPLSIRSFWGQFRPDLFRRFYWNNNEKQYKNDEHMLIFSVFGLNSDRIFFGDPSLGKMTVSWKNDENLWIFSVVGLNSDRIFFGDPSLGKRTPWYQRL